MIIEDLSKITILDGNGDPFDEGRRYFNRYQSIVPHEIRDIMLFVKHSKTVGGLEYDRPAVHCKIIYPHCSGGDTKRSQCTFESEFIEEGTYGFSRMIPVDTGIKLDFDYGDTSAYARAVHEKLGVKEREEKEPKMTGMDKYIFNATRTLTSLLNQACNHWNYLCPYLEKLASAADAALEGYQKDYPKQVEELITQRDK